MLTQIGWDVIYYTECALPDAFGGLSKDIIENIESWRKWAT